MLYCGRVSSKVDYKACTCTERLKEKSAISERTEVKCVINECAARFKQSISLSQIWPPSISLTRTHRCVLPAHFTRLAWT